MHTEGYCPDNVTFLAALDACATFAAFSENKPNSPSVDYEHSWCANVYTKKEGVQKVRYIHMAINSTGLERDVSVINALINAYGKYGAVHDAKSLFDTLQYPNFVTWTAMLAASTHSGDGEFALLLFRRMTLEGIAPTNITFACVLDASSSIGALSAGKIIHTTILHTDYIGDSLVENALLSMYGECRCMHIAEFIFTNMEFPNAVSWNSMIVTYSWNGYVKDALKFYDLMQWNGVEPDPITYVAVIHACAGLRALEEGCKLHTTVIMTGCEHRLAVASSLVSMYGNCMLVHDALGVFASVKYHDIVLWNSMLGALVLNENYKEALNLFSQMNSVGLQPDGITFCSILEVCAGTLSVKEGETVHLYVDLHGYAQHPMVGTALLDMYAKCGIISKARGVFDTLVHRSVVTWTAMVSCFAQNGAGSEALVLLQDMKNAGIELDILTFISIINACSYSGLVEEGAHYSVAMNRDYGLRGTLDFFLSIIDLLGRSGRLDEVQFMVHLVPFVEDGICWECFLASSRVHRDIDHGYQAACHCFEVDPEKASPFVALENLCVETMTFN
ncbi:hypothetical protein KP509_27G070400 [Ceratopteris richardii]|nr:hypothetical protein KP509_27G070400 [Ceratopteris richardii]